VKVTAMTQSADEPAEWHAEERLDTVTVSVYVCVKVRVRVIATYNITCSKGNCRVVGYSITMMLLCNSSLYLSFPNVLHLYLHISFSNAHVNYCFQLFRPLPCTMNGCNNRLMRCPIAATTLSPRRSRAYLGQVHSSRGGCFAASSACHASLQSAKCQHTHTHKHIHRRTASGLKNDAVFECVWPQNNY
jgi:hypothetical protein